MESMSQAPHLLVGSREGVKYGDWNLKDSMTLDGLFCSIDQLGMGEATERYNANYKLTRVDQDKFSAESHKRAAAATTAGKFTEEIVPIEIPQRKGESIIFSSDEGIRAQTSLETLTALKPAFAKDGTITAGSSSQISDGAAAVIVMSEAKAKELGLEILAHIEAHGMVAGPDASLQGQPARAIAKACAKAGLKPKELDLFEINEAFAAMVLSVLHELPEIDHAKVNPNGGAIAIGHPIGASGSRIIADLARALKARGGGIGVAAACIGVGQGIAMVIEV
jgi:acetyl-CoA C-acetyltransferase